MQFLWSLIKGKAVEPRAQAQFVATICDDIDELRPTDSAPQWQEEIIAISGLPLILTYRGSKGDPSVRLVTCQRLDQAGGQLYLWAYCHTRSAIRQFRADRIVELADADSGEVFGEPVSYLTQFRVDRSQRSKPGWGLGVRQRADFTALLNVLAFMARCDLDYHPLERASLEDIASRYWIRFDAPGDPDIDAILSHADRLAPDAETFYVSLLRCAEQPRLIEFVRNAAATMIDADGRHSSEELYWATELVDYLNGLP